MDGREGLLGFVDACCLMGDWPEWSPGGGGVEVEPGQRPMAWLRLVHIRTGTCEQRHRSG